MQALLALLFLSSSGVARAQGVTRVDLELVLAVDTSGSVNSTEFKLQIDGLVEVSTASASSVTRSASSADPSPGFAPI